jgi:sugar phosphate isomerase/epimerase
MPFQFSGFADEAGKTLQEQIAATKTLGWSAIDVRLVEGTNFCDLSEDKFLAAWDTLQAAGLKIVSYGSQIANWARPIGTDFEKDLSELKRNLPRMQKTGTKFIRCMSYPNEKEKPLTESAWKQEVFKRLKELAKVAAGGGVMLVHENCNGYGGLGPKQTLEMLDAIGSPSSFKLVFDTGNNSLHDNNCEVTWNFYREVREHVVQVHVKAGKAGPEGKHVTCYPDEDPVQSRIFADLKARNWSGYLSIEPHMAAAVHAGKDVADPKMAANIFVEYGRRLMKQVAAL